MDDRDFSNQLQHRYNFLKFDMVSYDSIIDIKLNYILIFKQE